jgi:Sigma-70, region 4
MRVTELDLSPAALACLAADIADVDQLVTHTADELVRKGFGATELHEIVCQLKRNDLALMPTPMAKVTYVPNERSSAVFRLRLVEGLTLDEIGERFGVSKERSQPSRRASLSMVTLSAHGFPTTNRRT